MVETTRVIKRGLRRIAIDCCFCCTKPQRGWKHRRCEKNSTTRDDAILIETPRCSTRDASVAVERSRPVRRDGCSFSPGGVLRFLLVAQIWLVWYACAHIVVSMRCSKRKTP
ncbi:unnamed protein product [Ectocarpus sp. 12 AP-2014]